MYTIGKVAKVVDVSVQLIRYYEDQELIHKPERGENGRRLYDENHIQQLHFIRQARHMGFSLKDIKELTSLRNEQYHNQRVHDIAQKHLGQVSESLEQIKHLKSQLENIIHQCENTPENQSCPILNLLDGSTKEIKKN